MLSWVAAAIATLFLVRFIAVAVREDHESSLLREPLELDSNDVAAALVAPDASHPTPRRVPDTTAIAARSGPRPLGVPSSPAHGVPAVRSAHAERVVPLGALTAGPVRHSSDRARRVASGGGSGGDAAPYRRQLADHAPHAADDSR